MVSPATNLNVSDLEIKLGSFLCVVTAMKRFLNIFDYFFEWYHFIRMQVGVGGKRFSCKSLLL